MSILEPINAAQPCGEDYKYDDEYLEVEVEIEKSFNATSESETEWDFVVFRCEKILKENTKDLKIASYWLYAQWKMNGWGTFLLSLDTYTTFIENYTTTLYPTVGRRKIKIFEWVERVFEEPLLKILEQFSEAQLEELLSILTRLETSVPLTIEGEYAFFKDVKLETNALLDAAKRKEEEAKRQAEFYSAEETKRREEEAILEEAQKFRRSEEEEILAKFGSSTSSNTFSSGMEKYKPLTHEDIDETINPQITMIKELFDKAPADYMAFKMLFSLSEMMLEEALNDSSVMCDDFVPSDDICKAVRQLSEVNNVSLEQLGALEEQLLLRPTWLEGYYIATKVLYKLERAEDASKLENLLIYFLHREERLLELQVNGTPLIADKMLSWANTKLLVLCDEGGSSIEYQRVYQEVLSIKKEQSTQNALTLLEEHYQSATGDEERFRWRLLFVDFALEIGDKHLALSLLLELERIIEAYQINKWQPELAITTYETLLKPIITQELGTEGKERIYNKLSILDIQKVINL
jgi:type VI secretion system protein VasJ